MGVPHSTVQKITAKDSPETVRDGLLELGFNGVVFQRWYPDALENWEGRIGPGFFEHYYGAQVYKSCAVAKTVHQWDRNYTFAEARASEAGEGLGAKRAEALFRQFGMDDGIVCFTGTNALKSAVFLTTKGPAFALMDQVGGLAALGAYTLTNVLKPGHPQLVKITRDDPKLSAQQMRILQMQIDHPELNNTEMAKALGMSPKTLHAHHQKIAKKNGVSTFTAAVIKHLRQTP